MADSEKPRINLSELLIEVGRFNRAAWAATREHSEVAFDMARRDIREWLDERGVDLVVDSATLPADRPRGNGDEDLR